MLSNCYANITTEEGESYSAYENPDDLSCSSERASYLLDFIPSRYETSVDTDKLEDYVKSLQPTTFQLLLAKAYHVRK